MPPEQARGETDKVDARTDIYSLGAILYHVLTLEPPISGDDIGQMLQSVAEGNVGAQLSAHARTRVRSGKPLPHIPGGKIPESLAAITRKAMALAREDRYRTVKELQAAVQACQAGVRTGPPAVSRESAGKSPALEGQKTMALIVFLCVVIAVLTGLCIKLVKDRTGEAAVPQGIRFGN